VVRKPTNDSVVTSLELFDADGETIAWMFGKRKPGTQELAARRNLTTSLDARRARFRARSRIRVRNSPT